MEAFNLYLFGLINAGAHPAPWALGAALFAANRLILAVPLMLVAGWLWGASRRRADMLLVFGAIAAALLVNVLIGLAWFHPRPFMVPVGHTFEAHVADSSFPSDHGTVMFTAAFVLLARAGRRGLGALLLLLGLATAWARVFIGVHFPLDMLGAAAVAAFAAALAARSDAWVGRQVLPLAEAVYRPLFAPFIRLGLVRR